MSELKRSAEVMIQLWWKSIRWMATAGVMLWFIVMPLLPIYGLVKPWPQAEQRLKQDGVTGFPLMIGAGSHGERRIDSSGEHWREEMQRSFVVLPDSFRRFEIFTYSEQKGSGIAGVQSEVFRSSLVTLIVTWVLAGVFTLWRIRRWSEKKKPNQLPEPMSGLAPGHGSS